jgi:phytoene synthase
MACALQHVSPPLQPHLARQRLGDLLAHARYLDIEGVDRQQRAALEGYVTDTSSALFSLGARIAAQPSAATDHLARHAGLAQGMAQVIATLPLDAARRQLFLPLQVLQEHGSGMEAVFSGKQTPGARAAIDQLVGEARKHLRTAFDLLVHVSPQTRPVFLPLALVHRELNRMSRADFDPFTPQPTSRLRILWTLWRASRTRQFGG